MDKEKSIGIIVLGSLVTLIGLSNLFMLILAARDISFFQGLISILFNIYISVCGIGILLLRNWARLSVIIISSLIALLSIVSLILFKNTSGLATFLFLLTLLVCFVNLYFFTRPKVKEQFKLKIK